MTQSDSPRRPWIAALFALAATVVTGNLASAQPALISDDFESYPAGENLDGKGGWSASRASGDVTGVTVVEGSSTSGGGDNARVVRFHHDKSREPNPDMRRTFTEESNYAVESTFLLRFNDLGEGVGMHNVVLRGPGGTATRLRFGPDGFVLLAARDEPGGSAKRMHKIIDRPIAGNWYRATLTADPKTQTTWASVVNLDSSEAKQRGESPKLPFFSNVSALTRWAVERASMTAVDVSIDDVEVRIVPDPDRAPAVDLSSLSGPGEVEAVDGSRVRMMDGRIDGEQAVVVEAGGLVWETPGLSGHHYAEFWFSPVAWNPVLGDEVVVASLRVGEADFVLRKAADRSELRLEQDGRVLQTYPTYSWDDRNWMTESMGRGVRGLIRRSVSWHHVHVAVDGGRLALTVDGFPARRVETADVSGPLSRLELRGEPGTAFAAVTAEMGTPMEAKELRERYVTLFLNEPRIMRNLITVPFLSQPPTVDGRVDEAEWAGAARIIGFGQVGSGSALTEEVVGYIGYDDDRVYVAMVTPTPTPVATDRGSSQRDEPLWEREAVAMTLSPPFVSGEDPRRAAQLIGDPAGNQTDLMELPARDLDWDAEWDWRASAGRGAWQGEMAASFDALSFPKPNDTDLWGFNLVNPKAAATWSHVEGGTNLGSLRFRRGAPLVRPVSFTLDGGEAKLSIEATGGEDEYALIVGMQLFGEGDRMPRQTVQEDLSLTRGQTERVDLTMDLDGQKAGRVALFVRQGHLYVYYHSVNFPPVKGR